MTDAPDMIRSMGKNNFTPQSVKSVNSEGGGFELTGFIVIVLGLVVGVVQMFATSIGPTAFVLIPAGLLFLIAGYLKKISSAVTATYTLAANQAVTTSHEADAHQA